jgi:S1-C subfamily serine protease
MGIKDIVLRESPAVVSVYNLDARGDVRGTGTGFIVKADGVLVTNFHVIHGADGLAVKLKNGEAYDRIWVMDVDPRRDIAVLKIQGVQLPTVRLGDSAKVEQGDWCVAIGNPQGLEHTVSDGLVSALRVMEGNQMFQISVPISPGSSGGPLYNSRGEVVAITTAALVGEGVQNLNFAVPLKYAIPMLDSPARMTLPEVAARYWPEETPREPAVASASAAYTDPTGIATITVEAGWSASPPTVQGAVMSVTKGPSNVQVMFLAGFRDVDAVFQIGRTAAEASLKKFSADSPLAQRDLAGRPGRMQYFRGEAQGVKVRAFVGALVTPKGGLMVFAVMPGGNLLESDAVARMFSSLR